MNYTHGAQQTQKNTHSTETRKSIGTISSQERYHISEPNIPILTLHCHFVNDGSGRGRVLFHNEIKNVKTVYLDALYIALPTGPFSVGLKFKKSVDHFYPDERHSGPMDLDNTLWNHPIFENTLLGTGSLVVIDERTRCIKSYRSAYTFSTIEVSLVDENGAPVNWTEINLNITCHTLDWQ